MLFEEEEETPNFELEAQSIQISTESEFGEVDPINRLLVDKSNFIKNFLLNQNDSLLISSPAGSGKSLFLSMVD